MDNKAYTEAVDRAFASFPTLVAKAPLDRRVRFYEALLHELTVAVRTVWADEHLRDAAKVELMKWLNEVMHRIINRIVDLRYNPTPIWSAQDDAAMLNEYSSENPRLAWLIAQSVFHSFWALEAPAPEVANNPAA